MASTTLPTARHFITQLLNALPSLQHPDEHNVNPTNPLSQQPDAVKKQLLSLQVLFPNEFVPALDLLDRRLVTRFHIRDNPPAAQNERTGPNKTARQDKRADPQAQPPQQSAIALNDASDDNIMPDAPISAPSPQPQQPAHTPSTTSSTIYYVRTAQHRPSRFHTSYDTLTTYEVHLRAWSCSCPAFAFAAFPSVHPEPAVPVRTSNGDDTAAATAVAAGWDLYTRRNDGDGEEEWIFGGVTLGEEVPPVCKHLLACVLVERCAGLFGGFVVEREVSVQEAAGWAAGWGD